MKRREGADTSGLSGWCALPIYRLRGVSLKSYVRTKLNAPIMQYTYIDLIKPF